MRIITIYVFCNQNLYLRNRTDIVKHGTHRARLCDVKVSCGRHAVTVIFQTTTFQIFTFILYLIIFTPTCCKHELYIHEQCHRFGSALLAHGYSEVQRQYILQSRRQLIEYPCVDSVNTYVSTLCLCDCGWVLLANDGETLIKHMERVH